MQCIWILPQGALCGNKPLIYVLNYTCLIFIIITWYEYLLFLKSRPLEVFNDGPTVRCPETSVKIRPDSVFGATSSLNHGPLPGNSHSAALPNYVNISNTAIYFKYVSSLLNYLYHNQIIIAYRLGKEFQNKKQLALLTNFKDRDFTSYDVQSAPNNACRVRNLYIWFLSQMEEKCSIFSLMKIYFLSNVNLEPSLDTPSTWTLNGWDRDMSQTRWFFSSEKSLNPDKEHGFKVIAKL